MAFNLGQFSKPIGEVATSIGRVYLYQVNEKTRKLFRELKDEPSEQRATATFCKITSQIVRERFSDDVVPLSPDVFSTLTEKDIADLTEMFRQRRDQHRVVTGKPSPEIGPQLDGEAALTFFDRVLGADIAATDAESGEANRKMLDSVTSPASKLLEQLNLSSARLGLTLNEYGSLSNNRLEMPHFVDHIGETNRRMAEARREDRNDAQLIGKMTAESAAALKELVDSAGKFLLRFDARDVKSDKETSSQLWFAIASLVASMIFSGVGVGYAAAAYNRDSAKIAADVAASRVAIERDERIEELLRQHTKALEALQSQNQKPEAQTKALRKP
jgi:hypothetical protein